MKKILPVLKAFALMFVLHFEVSILFGLLFQDNISVERTLCVSLLVSVVWTFLGRWFAKGKIDKDGQ